MMFLGCEGQVGRCSTLKLKEPCPASLWNSVDQLGLASPAGLAGLQDADEHR